MAITRFRSNAITGTIPAAVDVGSRLKFHAKQQVVIITSIDFTSSIDSTYSTVSF